MRNHEPYKSCFLLLLIMAIVFGLTDYNSIGKTQKLPSLAQSESIYFDIQNQGFSCSYTYALSKYVYQPLFEKELNRTSQRNSQKLITNSIIVSYITALKKEENSMIFSGNSILTKIPSGTSEEDTHLQIS